MTGQNYIKHLYVGTTVCVYLIVCKARVIFDLIACQDQRIRLILCCLRPTRGLHKLESVSYFIEIAHFTEIDVRKLILQNFGATLNLFRSTI